MRVRKASSQLIIIAAFMGVAFVVMPTIQPATDTQEYWAWIVAYVALAATAIVVIPFLNGPRRASLRDAIRRTGTEGPVYAVMLAPRGPGAAVLDVAALRLARTGVSLARLTGEDCVLPWDQVTAVRLARDGLGIRSRVELVTLGDREDFGFHLLADDGYAFANSAKTLALVTEIESRLNSDGTARE